MISECLHAPTATKNLISVAYLAANAGASTRQIDADETLLHISGDGGHAFLIAQCINILYVFNCVDAYEAGAPGMAVEATLAAEWMQTPATIDFLHRAFKHLPPARIKSML